MSRPTSTAVAQSIPVARRVAAGSPRSILPCPVCTATLRAENLDKHLAKVHSLSTGEEAGAPPESVAWTGADRSIVTLSLALPVACIIVAVLVVVLTRGELGDFPLFLGGGGPVAAFILYLLYRFRIVVAHLELTRDSAVLRRSFGVRRRVRLPAELEVGALYVFRRSAMFSSYSDSLPNEGEERRVGIYLRFIGGGSTITVGCLDASSPGKCWDARAWRAGRRRRGWQITVDRAAFVALQYLLAERGMLALRPQDCAAMARIADQGRSRSTT